VGDQLRVGVTEITDDEGLVVDVLGHLGEVGGQTHGLAARTHISAPDLRGGDLGASNRQHFGEPGLRRREGGVLAQQRVDLVGMPVEAARGHQPSHLGVLGVGHQAALLKESSSALSSWMAATMSGSKMLAPTCWMIGSPSSSTASFSPTTALGNTSASSWATKPWALAPESMSW